MSKTALVLMFSFFSLFGCKKEPMAKYPEYRWSISESAPKEYPVQIISGDIEALDGYHNGIPTRVDLNNGWGRGRSSIGAGREFLPAPKSMAITWYSYREDTFYRGEFDLPTERIADLLGNQKPNTYSGVPGDFGIFIVGVAPEGFVVVWLSRPG